MTPEFETRIPADLAADLELARPIMDAQLDAAAGELSKMEFSASPLKGSHSFAAKNPAMFSRGNLRRWVGYTAIAIVAGVIGVHQYVLPINQQGDSSSNLTTYSTLPGKRAQLELPDGSTISLSVASRVRYTRDFGKSGRHVYLEGEAYFEVPRKANAPFIVHTGNTATQVLGTSFGIRQYQGEPTIRVIVNAGKVQVKSSSAQRIVSSGEAVQASENSIAMVPMNPSATAWMRGELVFVKTPLADVVKEMERWYGINIELNDPALGKEPVSVTLGSQTPQGATQILAMMFGATTVHKGNTITIYKR